MKKLITFVTAFALSLGIWTGTAAAQPAHASAKAASVSVQVVSSDLYVRHGRSASVTVRGARHARGTITVYYNSGPSKAKGLYAKTSDSSGYVSWSWIVGSRTRPGTYIVHIILGGRSVNAHLHVS
ncbi:hypothetical protein [Heyndrickxia acidicola]|uniref:Uncharacterized protein n=1 Tax=Heyndrickxia acidicola TaxID=209389 RepID=A0ABU6MAU2_9BACI|nr:hypothetical protein [Heyndrickxia acidicola]MED1201792.1 hypothetical protein [Heyndrickxia acidicola]